MSTQQKDHNLAVTKYPPMKTHPYFNFIIPSMWRGQVLNKDQLNERERKKTMYPHASAIPMLHKHKPY